jgi:hypothetical protein
VLSEPVGRIGLRGKSGQNGGTKQFFAGFILNRPIMYKFRPKTQNRSVPHSTHMTHLKEVHEKFAEALGQGVVHSSALIVEDKIMNRSCR